MHTNNIVMGSPNIHIDRVEDTKKGKAPRDAVDNDFFTAREELVNNGAKEKKVYQRPRGT